MANDAFALSPISASSSLPSESDYEAISEAFMETARGRWFLKEYARRNRNADTAMVLEAVARIEATVAAQKREAEAAVTPIADVSPVAFSAALADALTKALETIRTAVDDARAAASDAVNQLTGGETFAPSRKAVRIIREVGWRLREVGYDSRICDILEAQAEVIGANNDTLQTRDAHAAVLAAFDLIGRRLDDLTDDLADDLTNDLAKADPTGAVPVSSKAPPAPADLAEARLAREKNALADAAPAQAAQAAAAPEPVPTAPIQSIPVSPTPAPVTSAPVRPVLQQPLPENVVSLAPAKPQSPVQAPVDEALVSHETAEVTNPSFAHAADPVPAEEPEPLTVATTALPPLLLPTTSAATPFPAVATVPDAIVQPAVAPPHSEDAASAAPPAAAEASAPAARVEVVQPLPAVVAESAPAPAPAEPLSLGKSLLARGMVNTSRTDPLAPVRRMSQAEKIAFFS